MERTDRDTVLKHVIGNRVLNKRHILRHGSEAANIVILDEGPEGGNVATGLAEFVDGFGKVDHGAFG